MPKLSGGAHDDGTIISGLAAADRARGWRGKLDPAAAGRFEVSPSAAVKLMQRVRRTGSLAPAKIGGHRRPVLEAHANEVRAIVSGKAGITLKEIRAALSERGVEVKALSTVADMLHRLGLSHKKSP